MSKTFSYFAYGSNLLTKRIHINNPSAVRIGIGKLQHYRLDFLTYSKRWKGCSATIVPHENKYVWGSIWELNQIHLETLHLQEGVKDGLYVPFTVEVELPDGTFKTCLVYQQSATPPYVEDVKDLPIERRPSVIYLNTILSGAEESQLPVEYLQYLKRIPHNGYDGDVDLNLNLNVID